MGGRMEGWWFSVCKTLECLVDSWFAESDACVVPRRKELPERSGEFFKLKL